MFIDIYSQNVNLFENGCIYIYIMFHEKHPYGPSSQLVFPFSNGSEDCPLWLLKNVVYFGFTTINWKLL